MADQEYSATEVMFYNTDGRSYTDTYQVDFNWTPVERLDIFATYRYTNSSMTLDRPDGGRAGRSTPRHSSTAPCACLRRRATRP